MQVAKLKYKFIVIHGVSLRLICGSIFASIIEKYKDVVVQLNLKNTHRIENVSLVGGGVL